MVGCIEPVTGENGQLDNWRLAFLVFSWPWSRSAHFRSTHFSATKMNAGDWSRGSAGGVSCCVVIQESSHGMADITLFLRNNVLVLVFLVFSVLVD